MTEIDPGALLADVRARKQRADAISARAYAKLGGGNAARSSRSVDDLTAEELERDAATIHRILAVWKRIGKREASPITLPSGRRLTPKSCETDTARGGLERRPRRRRRVLS